MTIKRLLRLVRSMYPTEFEDEVLLLWLSQCENTLLTEVMLLSVTDCTEYTEANDATLLVPHPYDKLYLPYMQAMICQANGETDKYMNHMQVYNAYRDEYARWVCATISPAYGEAIQNGYYLSAYSIAQAHGYSGTVEEWLASLKGPAGEPGKDGKPGLNGVGADPKYSAVLQQLFDDGSAGFPYMEEDLEGHEHGDYGIALIQRTEKERQNYGNVIMPSLGKVMELIRELGSGWVDVTEEFLAQQEPPEEYLRMRPQGRWQLFDGYMLYRAEIVENYDEKSVLLTSYSDDAYFFAKMYAGNDLVFELDSEDREAKLFGQEVWRGEGGRTYARVTEPENAPEESFWAVVSETSERGISFFYHQKKAPEDAPNGAVWLGPVGVEKPATPEGSISENVIRESVEAYLAKNPPKAMAQKIELNNKEEPVDAFLKITEEGRYKAVSKYSVDYCDVFVDPTQGTVFHKISSYNDDGTFMCFQYVNGKLQFDYSVDTDGTASIFNNVNVNQPTEAGHVANKSYVDATIAKLPTGGADKWEFIGEFNVGDEDVAEWIISEDAEGNPIELKQMVFQRVLQPSASTTSNTKLQLGNPAMAFPFATNVCYASMDWLTKAVSQDSSDGGNHVMHLYNSETSCYTLMFRMTSQYTGAWAVGRGVLKEGAKNCIGGLAMKSANPATGLIGAGSTIKMWGVRV